MEPYLGLHPQQYAPHLPTLLFRNTSTCTGGEGLKVETRSNTHAHLIAGDIIMTLDGQALNKPDDAWKIIANSLQPSICLEIVRTFEHDALERLSHLPHLPAATATATASFNSPLLPPRAAEDATALNQQLRKYVSELGLTEQDELLEATFGSSSDANPSLRSLVANLCQLPRSGASRCCIRFKRTIDRHDYQDNVLLELILAQELHLKYRSDSIGRALQPCSYLFPIFRTADVFSLHLGRKPSSVTNKKAREILQANQIEPSLRLKRNELSPHDVFNFFKKFQGFKTWEHGAEENQIQQCTQKVLSVIKDCAQRVESSFVKSHESNNSQSYELRSWLQLRNLSYYARILAHNDISSMLSFSQLDANTNTLSILASQGAKTSGRTQVFRLLLQNPKPLTINELRCRSTMNWLPQCCWPRRTSFLYRCRTGSRLLFLNPKPLTFFRYASFVDHDASFLTAAFSSKACEIMFTKPVTQFLAFVLASIGLIITIVAYIPEFNNGIILLAGAAAAFVNLSIMVLAASFYFLSLKYTRRMLYAVSFVGAVARLPTFILANRDPCFSDAQCWVPNRLISSVWLVCAAFTISFYQKNLVHILLMGGTITFAAFGLIGTDAV